MIVHTTSIRFGLRGACKTAGKKLVGQYANKRSKLAGKAEFLKNISSDIEKVCVSYVDESIIAM